MSSQAGGKASPPCGGRPSDLNDVISEPLFAEKHRKKESYYHIYC